MLLFSPPTLFEVTPTYLAIPVGFTGDFLVLLFWKESQLEVTEEQEKIPILKMDDGEFKNTFFIEIN